MDTENVHHDDMLLLNAGQEAKIDLLTDMGFSYFKSLTSLQSHGWNIESATDALLLAPESLSRMSSLTDEVPPLVPCPLSTDSTIKLELFKVVNGSDDLAEATRILSKMALAYREGTLTIEHRQKLKSQLVSGRSLVEIEAELDQSTASAVNSTRTFLSPHEATRLQLFRETSGDSRFQPPHPPSAAVMESRILKQEQDEEYQEAMRRDLEALELKARQADIMREEALREEAATCRRLQLVEAYRQDRAHREDCRASSHPVRLAVHCNTNNFPPNGQDVPTAANRVVFFFTKEEATSPDGMVALQSLITGLLLDLWVKCQGPHTPPTQEAQTLVDHASEARNPLAFEVPASSAHLLTTGITEQEALRGLEFSIYQTLPMRKICTVVDGVSSYASPGDGAGQVSLESCNLKGGGNVRVEEIDCSW